MSGQTHHEDQLVVRFLLGQLSEEEHSALEDRFIEDDALFEELKIAEEELIERYVDGGLGARDRADFESRMVISSNLRERVVFAKMLAGKIDTSVAPSLKPAPGFWQRILASSMFQQPAMRWALVAALLVIVLGAVTWRVKQSRLESQRLEAQRILEQQQREARERERANVQPQTPTPAPVPPQTPKSLESMKLAIVMLTPGQSRSTGGTSNELAIEPGHERARLTIIVEDNSYPNYHVQFEGVQSHKTFSREAQLQKPSDRLVLELPTTMLPNDDYIVKVDGVSATGTREPVSNYNLRVRRTFVQP